MADVSDIQNALQLLRNKRVTDAIDTLEYIIRVLPAHLMAYVLLARAYEFQGAWREALHAWDEAYLLMPTSPLVQEGRTRVLRRLDQAARQVEAKDTDVQAHELLDEWSDLDEGVDTETAHKALLELLSPPGSPSTKALPAARDMEEPPEEPQMHAGDAEAVEEDTSPSATASTEEAPPGEAGDSSSDASPPTAEELLPTDVFLAGPPSDTPEADAPATSVEDDNDETENDADGAGDVNASDTQTPLAEREVDAVEQDASETDEDESERKSERKSDKSERDAPSSSGPDTSISDLENLLTDLSSFDPSKDAPTRMTQESKEAQDQQDQKEAASADDGEDPEETTLPEPTDADAPDDPMADFIPDLPAFNTASDVPKESAEVPSTESAAASAEESENEEAEDEAAAPFHDASDDPEADDPEADDSELSLPGGEGLKEMIRAAEAASSALDAEMDAEGDSKMDAAAEGDAGSEDASALDDLREQAASEARAKQAMRDAESNAPSPAETTDARYSEPGSAHDIDDTTGDLDRLIRELEGARTSPQPTPDAIEDDPDVGPLPDPDLEYDIEDLVSETLGRIYASQGRYREAARIYVKLAAQEPDRAREHLERASELRVKSDTIREVREQTRRSTPDA